MADDLLALVRESSGGGKDREMLADELVAIRPAVKSGLKQLDWDSTELTLADCMSFYDDYVAVAKASRFIVGAPQDRVMMAANMTAIISTCAWNGEL